MAENRKNGTDAETGADNNAECCADATREPRAVRRAETCADARAEPYAEPRAVIRADRFAEKNGSDAETLAELT